MFYGLQLPRNASLLVDINNLLLSKQKRDCKYLFLSIVLFSFYLTGYNVFKHTDDPLLRKSE